MNPAELDVAARWLVRDYTERPYALVGHASRVLAGPADGERRLKCVAVRLFSVDRSLASILPARVDVKGRPRLTYAPLTLQET